MSTYESIPPFSRYGQGDAHMAFWQILKDSGYDPDVAPFPGFPALSKGYNAAGFTGATNEAKITNAIAKAVTDGKTYVYVPATMLPYNASLVTFSASVHMLREGGPTDVSVYDCDAYGITGDGVTDVTAALNVILVMLTAGQTLKGIPGKTYAIKMGDGVAASALLVQDAYTTLDFQGATLKYTGANNFDFEAGAGLGVVNVAADYCTIKGTIDCNSKAAHALALYMWTGTVGRGTGIDLTILNTNESLARSWTGIAWSLSPNVGHGVTVTANYHRDIVGWLRRPNCPFLDGSDNIAGHGDVSSLAFGGPTTDTGSTTAFLCRSDSPWNTGMAKPDPKGILRYPTAFNVRPSDTNNHWLDFVCNDLGASQIELYGGLFPVPQRPTWASSIAVNPFSAMVYDITATSDIAVTIAIPSAGNGSDRGNPMRFVFYNNSGGNLTTPIAFATGTGGYKALSGVSPPNGGTVVVEFTYDFVRNLWIESYRSTYVLFQRSGLNTTATVDGSVTSFSLPAGTLSMNGQAIRIRASGREVTQTGAVNVKFGATQIVSLSPTAGASWHLDLTVTRTGATTQLANGMFAFGANIATTAAQPAETLANAITVDFRGSVTAGGTLDYDYVMIEIISAGA